MPPDTQPEQSSCTRSAADAPFRHAVLAALRGSRADYTRVPLPRAILLLALPMMLELVMESTFGLVDIYFVGKLGSEAVATVGLTGSVIILVFAVAMGLCMGTTAMVSRRIGEGDPAAAGVAAWQAIVVGVAVSIPIGIFGYFSAPKMLRLMGGSEPIVAGYGYTAVLFAGSATIFLLFLNNAIFRGAGDAAVAMRVLWFANIVNMILDPLLISASAPSPSSVSRAPRWPPRSAAGWASAISCAFFSGRGSASPSPAKRCIGRRTLPGACCAYPRRR